MKQQALILKHHGKRLTVLEHSGQRFDVIISSRYRHQMLSEGVIISYKAKIKHKDIFFIEDPQIAYFPLVFARENIELMHCLLELSYYFIPSGSCAFGVFDFFIEVYALSEENSLKQSIMLVVKLLVILGIYPLEKEFQQAVQMVLVTPIDNISQSVLELTQEDLFKRWVQWCIVDHPYGNFFKAVPVFLKVKRL
ncbi:hypothetical protein EBU24_03745 [bacterium]|nr:hypothetical protein [bacterium]